MLPLVLALAGLPVSTDRTFSVAPFHTVELATGATLRVEQVPVARVVATGDPRMVRCVTAEVRDGRLVIGWAGERRLSSRAAPAGDTIVVTARPDCRREGNPQRLSIRVGAPLIDGVTLSDRGIVAVSPLRTPAFAAAIPGRGSITIDGLQTERTHFAIGGIGRIAATGDLGRLGINLVGSGAVDTRAAHAQALEVTLGGQGDVAAAVDGPAAGMLEGRGTITVGGHPTCGIRREGSGRIVCPAG